MQGMEDPSKSFGAENPLKSFVSIIFPYFIFENITLILNLDVLGAPSWLSP